MSVAACADLVRRGDPDRFLSAMTAPPASRGALMVLYAFNLEIARAAWEPKEPMIAQMRLQFWRDLLEAEKQNAGNASHEVAAALLNLLREKSLPIEDLHRMIDARDFDIAREPHVDATALWKYAEDGAGNLLWLSACAMGAERTAAEDLRRLGKTHGIAGILRAYAALKSATRQPLPDASAQGISALATDALEQLKLSRPALRALPSAVFPALRAGFSAKADLVSARRHPERVLNGNLERSDFSKRLLLFRGLLRGW